MTTINNLSIVLIVAIVSMYSRNVLSLDEAEK